MSGSFTTTVSILDAQPLSRKLLSSVLLALSVSTSFVHAETDTSGERAEAHGESEHFPAHTWGLFAGSTTEDRRSEDRRKGATLGLEYEYRANASFGVGFAAEAITGDFGTNVFVLPVAYHNGPWKLYAGPGLERSKHGNEKLIRLGAEYGFHFSRYEISPQLDVDFVDGERLLVIGVVFARHF